MDNEALDNFIKLQDIVLVTLDNSAREFKKSVLSVRSVFRTFCVIAMLAYIFLVSPVAIFTIDQWLREIVKNLPGLVQTLIRVIAAASSFVVLMWLFTFPVSYLSRIYTKSKLIIVLAQVLLFNPVLVLFLAYILSLLTGTDINTQNVFALYMLIIIALLILFVIIFMLLSIIGVLVPEDFFLILTSTRLSALNKSSFSHDNIVRKGVDIASSAVKDWTEQMLQEVDNISQRRYNTLISNLQAISVSVGVLGLINLITIVMSPDQTNTIFGFIDYLLNQINVYMGEQSSFNGSSLQLFRILVFSLFVIFIVIDFLNFSYCYRVSRATEIVGVTCLLRLKEIREEKAAQIALGTSSTSPKISLLRRLLQWIKQKDRSRH